MQIFQANQAINTFLHILLTAHARQNMGRQAVVFDIDDTIIDSQSNQPIPIMSELYNLCIRYGYEIIFITARPDTGNNAEVTREQLMHLGFSIFTALYLRPKHMNDLCAFKTDVRDSLHGIQLVGLIGNRWHDILRPDEIPPKDEEMCAVIIKPNSVLLKIGWDCLHQQLDK